MKKTMPALLLFGMVACWVLADMDRMASARPVRRGESSVFRRVEYDQGRDALVLTFKNGTVYEYLGVAPEHADRMLSGAGNGAFFNRHIRGQYACRRIGSEQSRSD